MANRLSTSTLAAGVLCVLVVSAGCGKDAPTSPSRPTTPTAPTAPTAPKSPIALTVNGISPSSGSPSGGTQVAISGFGFTSDSTVVFGGAPMTVVYVNSQYLTATTPARAAGSVDIEVINPGGESSRLEGAYTYLVIPPPSITGIQRNVGSTSGGGPVTITGSGFVTGAVATLDGDRISGYVHLGSTIIATAPAHAAGKVDLVVTNPDGQTATLSGGYTYVSPETFDIDGVWKGGADSNYGTDFGFTIQNGALIRVSCGMFSMETPAVPVVTGRFSFTDTEGVSISGAIVSPGLALGWISIGGASFCNQEPWSAEKQ